MASVPRLKKKVSECWENYGFDVCYYDDGTRSFTPAVMGTGLQHSGKR